jgi:hypothetical protein
MALAPFHLHIDNDETGRFRLQFELRIGHRRILRDVGFDASIDELSRVVNVTEKEGSGIKVLGKDFA